MGKKEREKCEILNTWGSAILKKQSKIKIIYKFDSFHVFFFLITFAQLDSQTTWLLPGGPLLKGLGKIKKTASLLCYPLYRQTRAAVLPSHTSALQLNELLLHFRYLPRFWGF
jgi:hypothetical protein